MPDYRNELHAPPHTGVPAGMKDEVSQDGIVCTAAGPAPRRDIPTRGYIWFSWFAPIVAAASTFTTLFSGGVVPSFGGFAVSDAVIICTVLLLITLLNFIVMTALWARQHHDAKGLLATIIAWSAAGLYIWAPFSISHPQPHKRHSDDEHKLWAAALGADLPAFQKAVDRYGPDSEPSTLDSLYNVLILRGKTDFVRKLQTGIPIHLSSLTEASNYRALLERRPLVHCATGARVEHSINGMTAALFGLQPELRRVVLDYAGPHELNNGLNYAIRADAPELVAELLRRGVSLERAVLMYKGYESRQDGPISRLTLIKFLIEARAARVLKWFLTDGRPHFDALDASECGLQCGPVEIAWGSGGVRSVQALIDRGLPISSDKKRRQLILAALHPPVDPETIEDQQSRLSSYQGDDPGPRRPATDCLDAFLAKQAAGPHEN